MGAHTDAAQGMTLAAVSIPYTKFIMADVLAKFKPYAVNVWGVNAEGKTDQEVATEGLHHMEQFMEEIGLVTNSAELGVTDAMLEDIANSTFFMEGGYKVLTHADVVEILKMSM